jgi:hypothetical protein
MRLTVRGSPDRVAVEPGTDDASHVVHVNRMTEMQCSRGRSAPRNEIERSAALRDARDKGPGLPCSHGAGRQRPSKRSRRSVGSAGALADIREPVPQDVVVEQLEVRFDQLEVVGHYGVVARKDAVDLVEVLLGHE